MTPVRRSALVRAAALAVALTARSATAEALQAAAPGSTAPARDGGDERAQALFEAGLAAASAKNWKLALERFLESQRYEQAPGTTLNVARCREHLGQLAEAIGDFETVLEEIPPDDERAKYARSRITALEPRVGHVTLTLAPELDGARVYWDGEELPRAAFGGPFPVNPGRHEVSMRAPGRKHELIRLAVSAGDHAELVLGSEPARKPEGDDAPDEKRPAAPLGTQALLGYGSLGLGTAGLVVGAVTGLLALDRKGTMEANCREQRCNSEGFGASQSGADFAAVSTVSFGASVAFLSAGALLLYFDSAAGSPRIGLTATGDGARLIVGGSL